MKKIAVLLIVGLLFVLVWGSIPVEAQSAGAQFPLGEFLEAVVKGFQLIVAAIIEVAAALMGMPI